MKKKINIIIVIGLIAIIGCFGGYYFTKETKNNYKENYISEKKLSDDEKFILFNPDSEDYVFSYNYNLNDYYVVSVEAYKNNNKVYDEKISQLRGEGVYYFKLSEQENNIRYYNYFRNDTISGSPWNDIDLKIDDASPMITYYFDISSETGISSDKDFDGKDTLTLKDNDKHVIGGISWGQTKIGSSDNNNSQDNYKVIINIQKDNVK